MSSKPMPRNSLIVFYCLALSMLVLLFVWSGYHTSRVFVGFSNHIEELEVALISLEDCLLRLRECEADLRLAAQKDGASYLGSYTVRRSSIEPQLKSLVLPSDSDLKELFSEQLRRQSRVIALIRSGELKSAAESLREGEAGFEALSEKAESMKLSVLSRLREETERVRRVCTEFLCETIIASCLLILFSVFLVLANRRFLRESERLMETSKKLALLVDTSFDAIFFADKDLVIRSWSPACSRLFGYSSEEAIGQSLNLITPAFLSHELASYRAAAFKGQAIEPYETKRSSKSGKELIVSVSVSPVVTGYDAVDGITIVMRDVSAQRLLQQQKDDLIAALAHDLKNPLISSNVLLEIIRDDFNSLEPETIRDISGRVALANNRMIETVNEMLDVYRLESGSIEVELKPVDITQLCFDLQSELSLAFERKKIEFSLDVKDGLCAVTDGRVLRRILYNLLDNALKHCQEGAEVNFSAERAGSNLVLTVSDDGPGLSAQERSRAFQRIFRAPVAGKREGSGLGLYAARLMADLLNVSLDCQSSPGAGTRFRVELP
ncbi:MAG: PAS domain-containing sensor histidine kinase [Candidatus Melainabacteria bacterium]|nr:PAS domain-containing sensor histidine kinase [Candidatus Melainabacteria bacterium]